MYSGVVSTLTGFAVFAYGFMAGMTAIFSGVVIIILSLASLGVTYCFLAIVKVQIDSRNAIVKYTTSKQLD